MNIFDILGPVMVGPSSSHTAGAARMGYMTRRLLGEEPVKAHIGMYGSFAATGKGHGTDKALVGGLLGMQPDDMDIPGSLDEWWNDRPEGDTGSAFEDWWNSLFPSGDENDPAVPPTDMEP